MLFAAGTIFLDLAFLVLLVIPIAAFVVFAFWFMRRDDDGNRQ